MRRCSRRRCRRHAQVMHRQQLGHRFCRLEVRPVRPRQGAQTTYTISFPDQHVGLLPSGALWSFRWTVASRSSSRRPTALALKSGRCTRRYVLCHDPVTIPDKLGCTRIIHPRSCTEHIPYECRLVLSRVFAIKVGNLRISTYVLLGARTMLIGGQGTMVRLTPSVYYRKVFIAFGLQSSSLLL